MRVTFRGGIPKVRAPWVKRKLKLPCGVRTVWRVTHDAGCKLPKLTSRRVFAAGGTAKISTEGPLAALPDSHQPATGRDECALVYIKLDSAESLVSTDKHFLHVSQNVKSVVIYDAEMKLLKTLKF